MLKPQAGLEISDIHGPIVSTMTCVGSCETSDQPGAGLRTKRLRGDLIRRDPGPFDLGLAQVSVFEHPKIGPGEKVPRVDLSCHFILP